MEKKKEKSDILKQKQNDNQKMMKWITGEASNNLK